MRRSFSDPDTHFRILKAETSVGNDGVRLGEPDELVCDECGASLPITREPSPGIDELPHKPGCGQRWTRSRWWAEHFDDD